MSCRRSAERRRTLRCYVWVMSDDLFDVRNEYDKCDEEV